MATTASPLPEPQQVQLAPMDNLIIAAANAVNGTHPEIVAGVAQSSNNVADAVTNTQAAAHLTDIQNTIDLLHQQNHEVQQKVWDTLNASQQGQYQSAGYTPPARSRSLWGDIVHTGEDITKPIFSSKPVSDVLNVMGAPLRAVQHVERATFSLANQSPNDPAGLNIPFGGLFGGNPVELAKSAGVLALTHPVSSLEDWSKAWKETNNGEQYILPQVQRQALNKWGQGTYQIAYQLATGKDPQQLIQAAGNNPTAQQNLMVQIQSKPVQDATAFLNAGHVSVGRMIMGQGFMASHPGPGAAMSGAFDALFDLTSDPTIIGGGRIAEVAHARYLVQTPEDVQRLYDSRPAVRKAFGDIADAVATKNVSRLMDYGTTNSSKQAMSQLIAAQADTQEKVLEWYKNTAKGVELVSGNPSNTMVLSQQLPHLTPIGYARLAAKGTMRDAIDWAADHQIAIDGVKDSDVTKPPGVLTPLRDKLILGSGKFGRMATTLTHQGHVFNPAAPDAANVFRDIGLTYLPRQVVDDYVYKFAQDPRINARMKLFRSMMIDLADASGVGDNEEARQAFIGRFDSTYGRKYGIAGNDVVTDDAGNNAHVGLGKNDMAEHFAIPSPRDLLINSRKAAGTAGITGAINASWMDKWLMDWWRPLTLAHPGFALRVGGEEAFGHLLRTGPAEYFRNAAQAVIAKNAQRLAIEEAEGELPIMDTHLDDLTQNEAANTWHLYTSGLTQAAKDSIHTVGDMVKEHIVDNVRRAMLKTSIALTSDDYRDAVVARMATGKMGLPQEVTAMHYDEPTTASQVDSGDFIRKRVNGKMVPLQLVGGNEYKGYKQTDELFHRMYSRQLTRMATDDWYRAALSKRPYQPEGAAEPDWSFAGRVNRVADALQADPMWREISERALQDSAGRTVANGEITERQAAMDHATHLIKEADALTHSPPSKVLNADGSVKLDEQGNASWQKGGEIPGLRDYLLKTGRSPSIAALEEMPLSQLPREVHGPEVVVNEHPENIINRATGWLFRNQIGPNINSISRKPMWWHAYTAARKDLLKTTVPMWKSMGLSDENIAENLDHVAEQRAIENTIKFVHNPELRSQLSTVTRNLSPFWFAQEQFYKRWARTFAYSPAAIRKAQLIAGGVRHSGLTHIDPETGQEYFVYPGSALVQQVLTDTLSRFGIQSAIPVQAALTGQVNMLNPGLQRVGLPQWGPLLNVPMNGIKQIDPHMTSAIDRIQGAQAASDGYLKSIFPSTVMHALQIALPGATAAGQLASTQMQAIQYLEATGHGMGTPATTQVQSMDIPNPQPGDYYIPGGVGSASYVYQPDGHWKLDNARTMQQYLDRVKNWSRILLVTRSLFGFAAPAAPTAQFNPDGLDTQLKTLMNQMPFNEAVATFLQEHPDATPMTVFQTQSQVGSTLPATAAAENFLNDNSKLVNGHPLAATFFIPEPDTSGKFSLAGYQEQLAEGLRQRKSPSQFYNEIVYQQSANIYFYVENQKNQALASHSGPVREIDDQWTQWSESFMQANPIFAALLGQSGTPGVVAASQAGRQQIMEDIGGALQDGSAPQNQQTAAVATLYNNWVMWQQMTQNYGNPNTPAPSATVALNINEEFARWLAGFEQQNPGVTPLVQRAIRPDLSQALNDLAAQGTVLTI